MKEPWKKSVIIFPPGNDVSFKEEIK